MRSALVLLTLLALAGCGIKGPLYLPDQKPAGKAARQQPADQPVSQPVPEAPAR